jgi:photosystem II stability/assembly factor-like uncharacterized protein
MAQATGGNIRIWPKRGIGPHYAFEYEGCATKNDADLAPGDFTAILCDSSAEHGKTVVVDIVLGEAGLPTTSIGVLWSQAQWLMRQSKICPMTLDFRFGYCERPDDESGWDSILRFNMARVQPSGVNLGADATTKVEVEANVAGESYATLYRLTLGSVDVGDTVGLDAVLVISEGECAGDCGPGYEPCSYVFVATEGEYLDTAEIYYTTDGGATWAAMAASPFAAGESISAIVGTVSGDDMRLVVFRGTTDAGNPAECAITTDWGATWANVDIGDDNGQFITSAFRRGRKIWAGTDDGFIYYSSDFANTWTEQHEGTAITNDVNFIHMFSDAIGIAVCNSDEGVYTTDGSTWGAIGDVVAGSEPDLLSCWMTTQWIAYAGTSTGYVYYSLDRGATWTQLASLTDPIHRIKFFDVENGYLIAGETIYRTIDGGATWTAQTTPAAAILRDLSLCDANEFWAVGQTSGDLDIAVHGEPVPEVPI